MLPVCHSPDNRPDSIETSVVFIFGDTTSQRPLVYAMQYSPVWTYVLGRLVENTARIPVSVLH